MIMIYDFFNFLNSHQGEKTWENGTATTALWNEKSSVSSEITSLSPSSSKNM